MENVENLTSKIESPGTNTETNNTGTTDNITVSNEEEYFSLSEEEEEEGFDDEVEGCDGGAAEGEDGKCASENGEIEEETIKLKELSLTDVEVEEFRCKTLKLKNEGNEEYKMGNYWRAVDLYTEALKICLHRLTDDRAIIYSNRAAAFIKLSENEKALEDIKKAVDLKPTYVRARLRRAELYEKLEKFDEALEDYQEVLKQDASQHDARSACMRLPTIINERNEKMKNEMIGKLKELGNMVLKPFGLSTENFKMQQDPTTGSYSINFQQNPSS